MKKYILLSVIFLFLLIYLYLNVENNYLIFTGDEIIYYLVKDKSMLEKSNSYRNINNKFISFITNSDVTKPETLLLNNYSPAEIKEVIKEKETTEPLVYIYNTHQREEYASSTLEAYNIVPNVLIGSYILQEQLKKHNINAIVEDYDIIKEVNDNKLNYSKTYDISRRLFKEKKAKYPSIKYFIDFHRDSLSKELSTTKINNKSYAKLMFVIGKGNKKYEKNLLLMQKIDKNLKAIDSTLSRGIFERNYIYNQDLSENAILIEVGGQLNTIDEIYNSLESLAVSLVKVIKDEK